MAILGTCRTCGASVSSEAETCPQCGEPNPFQPAVSAEVRHLVEQGRKIAAIKHYRQETGAQLVDAKRVVDALAADGTVAGASAAPPRQRSGVVRLIVLVAALVLAAVVLWPMLSG